MTDDDGYAFIGLGFSLGEDFNKPFVNIPLVIRVCAIKPPPYDICFTIRDNTETFEKIFLLGVLVFWIWGMNYAIKVYIDGVYENKNKPKQR